MDRKSQRHGGLLEAVWSLHKHDELQQTLAHNCKSFEECSNSTDACGEGTYFLHLAQLMQGTLDELCLLKAKKVDQVISGIMPLAVEDGLPLFYFSSLPRRCSLELWLVCSV